MGVMPSLKKRVVVTGIGIVSPIGNTRESTWQAAIEGKSGIRKITLFDTKDCAVQIAGEVKNFEATKAIQAPLYPRGKNAAPITQAVNAKDAKRMDRFIHLALVAGLEAYEDSGLDAFRDQIDATEIGINIGVGMGGLP